VRLPTASRNEMLALVTAAGLHHVDTAIAMGKGLILVSGHFGPYELAAAWMGAKGYQLHAIAEELDPEVMEALSAFRSVTGMQLLPLRSAVPASQAVLEARGILVIAADRAIGASRSAIDLPWGAGTRPIPIGAATFALDSGAPIVIAHITRYHSAPSRYFLEVDPPIVVSTGVDRDALTRRISDRLAETAIAHPDEWFVFQPLWRDRTNDHGVRS
jgi:lauroyl/myristoyl acyltransferase